MDRFLADIPLFVEVAKRKSFTRAADALDVPLPTVSRRIAVMERNLGVKLFNRNNRKVEMTEAGKNFYERCEFIVAEADAAREEVLQAQQCVSGRIRISVPLTLYLICMQGMLCSFAEEYPGIEMHVDFSLEPVGFHGEAYDLKICGGPLPDSSLKARRLIGSALGLYASPSYLGQRPLPGEPRDIRGMPYIEIKGFAAHGLELRKGDQVEHVAMKPAHVVSNMALSLEFLMAGQGIAALPVEIARRYEKAGTLQRILPEWSARGVDMYLVRPEGLLPRRVQIFMQHVTEHFQKISHGTG